MLKIKDTNFKQWHQSTIMAANPKASCIHVHTCNILTLAQRSSALKFELDSDLFCSENFTSWDWLTGAQLSNSNIIQIFFTQKRF